MGGVFAQLPRRAGDSQPPMAALARTLGRKQPGGRRSRPREYTSIVYHHALRRNATGSTGASLSPRPFFFSRSFSLPRARVCSVVSADADLLTTGRIFSAQCRPRPHAAVMREVERAGCSRAVWRCWRAAGRGSPIDADLRYMHDALHRPCTL